MSDEPVDHHEHHEHEVRASKSLAQVKVAAVGDTLKGDKYSGPEWDAHKSLNDAARALANGGGRSMEMQSAAISILSTVVTLDRMREPQRFRDNFALIHDAGCLVKRHSTVDAAGNVIPPWAQDVCKMGDGSELNFTLFGNKIASKGRAATVISVILSAIAAIIMIVGGMFYWLNKGDREAWKKEIRAELMSIGDKQAGK